jgi:hypothetical protein
LNELSEQALDTLIERWEKELGYKIQIDPENLAENMTIGRMIEFLDEKSDTVFNFDGVEKKNEVTEKFWRVAHGERLIEKDELCDALWSACRELLKKESG